MSRTNILMMNKLIDLKEERDLKKRYHNLFMYE